MREQYTVLEKRRDHNYFRQDMPCLGKGESRLVVQPRTGHVKTHSSGVIEIREREQVFSEKEGCVWGGIELELKPVVSTIHICRRLRLK